jgi:DNA polymerase-3 subunit delta'
MITTMLTHHWPVYGHDWAVNHLRKSMANRRVRHGYLIVGPASVGKETLARAFAMALNCQHPDPARHPCGECRSCQLIASGNHPDMIYSETDPSTGALKIEEIRSVMSRLALKPFEAHHRIAIFRDFDHAAPRAQDALLKTLEEPSPHALLLLLAEEPESLLATITSRAQILHLRPIPATVVRDVLVGQFGADSEQATLLARLSGGRLGWAIDALRDESRLEQRTEALNLLEEGLKLNRKGRFDLADELARDKQALGPLLELWLTYWRDVSLLCEGSRLFPTNYDRSAQLERLAADLTPDEALSALKLTGETLKNLSLNINTRLALEVMFLSYPGLAKG